MSPEALFQKATMWKRQRSIESSRNKSTLKQALCTLARSSLEEGHMCKRLKKSRHADFASPLKLKQQEIIPKGW